MDINIHDVILPHPRHLTSVPLPSSHGVLGPSLYYLRFRICWLSVWKPLL